MKKGIRGVSDDNVPRVATTMYVLAKAWNARSRTTNPIQSYIHPSSHSWNKKGMIDYHTQYKIMIVMIRLIGCGAWHWLPHASSFPTTQHVSSLVTRSILTSQDRWYDMIWYDICEWVKANSGTCCGGGHPSAITLGWNDGWSAWTCMALGCVAAPNNNNRPRIDYVFGVTACHGFDGCHRIRHT